MRCAAINVVSDYVGRKYLRACARHCVTSSPQGEDYVMLLSENYITQHDSAQQPSPSVAARRRADSVRIYC